MKVSAGTVARTICLGLALINQGLSIAGKPVIPIEDNDVEQFVSFGFIIVTALAAWWKNNSYTKEAIAADLYKQELKQEGK